MNKPFDFSGWATKNNLRCSDGRTIRENAFADNDGQTVPLVWNHQHNDSFNVLGHALLKNDKNGVRTFIKFNEDTEQGRNAKALVEHGDVTALSIFANQLKQNGGDVLHGMIREVSLVLAGANPGAFIDSVSFAHGNEAEDEAIIYTGEPVSLYHSDDLDDDEKKKKPEDSKDKKSDDEETVNDVFNTLNEKQKTVVFAMIGEAMNSGKDDDDEDDDEDDEKEKGGTPTMKHNIFDNGQADNQNVISHADQMDILETAKNSSVGTFKNAMDIYMSENNLQHDAVSGGFEANNINLLFPEYKDVRPGAPELITNDQGWITTVMSKVHKSPISRVRTQQVDIRNIEHATAALRARGYQKGKQKVQAGNFKLVRRTTDPQTVYVKNALHRDDIVDITDFDYVQYLYNIDRLMLNEELATAIMLGDGRDDGDSDKIFPEHIRPIWLDDNLYTIHKDLDLDAAKVELHGSKVQEFGSNYMYAEGMINTMLYTREDYKGTGTPDLFITPHMLNVMLLARDLNGRRIYSSKAELAQALNVGEIYTAEQFEGKTRTTTDNKTKKLLCIVANLADYSLGSTKGGEVSHFTQFDIKFNQELSLLETRVSGALTRVYSAIAIEEDVTPKTQPGAVSA